MAAGPVPRGRGIRPRLRGFLARFGEKATSGLRAMLPLAVRRRLVARLGHLAWFRRTWYPLELLRDWGEREPDAMHHFLWSRHLAYAARFEPDARFNGPVDAARLILFDDVCAQLRTRGIDPQRDIASVLEVGCSVGHLLRHAEQKIFPHATILEGVDIDATAIRLGSAQLRRLGSRAQIHLADITQLDEVLAGRTFDIVLCAGVLMYLDAETSLHLVSTMLAHARAMVAITGVADPTADNATLPHSRVRAIDHAFIHNIDRMVVRAGGRVAWRRWEGGREVDGISLYTVLATHA